jgi:DNA-binding XRE family transcriptional regulator
MRVETITRRGKDFAVIPIKALQRLIEDAEMLADVKAYDAAKARLEDGSEELIPLEITERRLRGEPALRIWREYRKLTQERLAKKAKVSRALIAAIETKRKAGSVRTWKRLGAALDVGWERLA